LCALFGQKSVSSLSIIYFAAELLRTQKMAVFRSHTIQCRPMVYI